MMLCDLGVHPSLRTATPRTTDGSAAGNVRTRASENADQCLGLSLRATLNTTLELQHTSPRLERLRVLLSPSAYRGSRAEEKRKALPDNDVSAALSIVLLLRFFALGKGPLRSNVERLTVMHGTF